MSVTFPIKGNVKVLSWISAWSEWKWEFWPHNHILTSRRLNWIGEPLSCLPRRMKLNKLAWQRQSFDGLQKHWSTTMCCTLCMITSSEFKICSIYSVWVWRGIWDRGNVHFCVLESVNIQIVSHVFDTSIFYLLKNGIHFVFLINLFRGGRV